MRIAITLIVFLPVFVLAQAEKKIEFRRFESLWRIDSNLFYEVESKSKKMYWNEKAIDSTGIGLYPKAYFEQGIVGASTKDYSSWKLFRVDSAGRIFQLGVIDKLYQPFFTTFNFFVSRIRTTKNEGDVSLLNERSLYQINFKDGKLGRYFDVHAATGLDSTDGRDLCRLDGLLNNKAIATICECFGECLYHQYYLIDLLSGRVTKLELNTKEPDNTELYQVQVVAADQSHIQVEISGAINNANNGTFIYDYGFKEITSCLEKEWRVLGLNYWKGRPISENIRSRLDTGAEVIITYRFSMPLERSLYRIYSNMELAPEDLRKCSKHERDIIRNMVYAKHNYRFKNEFYQAYFNYYKFYNAPDKVTSRKSNVDSLLTSQDKLNLDLITKFSNK